MRLCQAWYDASDISDNKLSFCLLWKDSIGVMLDNWHHDMGMGDGKEITTEGDNGWHRLRMKYKDIKRI